MTAPATVGLVGGLQVDVVLPERTNYDAAALGAKTPRVMIRLRNTSAHTVRVAPLTVRFEARRGGVELKCADEVGAPLGVREVSELTAGQEASVARELDCALPLPGSYDIVATVQVATPGRPSVARGTLEVAATGPVPRAVPGSALHVLVTGPRALRAMPKDAWLRPENAAVVAFINGGAALLPLKGIKLGFSVYKRGTEFPCAGQAEPLALPEVLPALGMTVARAPITCAPSEQGDYVIVGRLHTDEHPAELDIGRFALRVTHSPLLFAPDYANP